MEVDFQGGVEGELKGLVLQVTHGTHGRLFVLQISAPMGSLVVRADA
jgi:hypothetical protein